MIRSRSPHAIGARVPGVLLLVVIALGSSFIAELLPPWVGKVFVAVLVGILIRNAVRLPKDIFEPGIRLGLRQFLKIAIILLGAGISFAEIVANGSLALLVIVVLLIVAFAVTFLTGRFMKVSFRQKLLVAVGAAICGNTAIVTVAPLIDAEDDEIAIAVGIVTLFGVLGVFAFPAVGFLLGMSDRVFGAWAGTAINDTSQVVAAGFMYSEAAGKIATTVKLTRNIMIVPVVLLTTFFYRRNNRSGVDRVSLAKVFPTFILGFLFFALLSSLGLLAWTPGIGANTWSLSKLLVEASKFLILVALSGIGLGVDLRKLVKMGASPLILGFSVEVLMALFAFFLNSSMFAS